MTSHDSHLFLEPGAIVEPLFNQWHAWAYLLSPATSAMFVANTHLKLLKSFGAAPQVHASALKNRAMRGGPYVDLDASRAPEARALHERTAREQAHTVELAEAMKAVDRMLGEEAKGYSLEALYKKVPAPLKGLIELVYDMYDNPSARVIEGLLFETRHHDPTRESVRLTRDDPDARPFALATPRLGSPGDVVLPLPFASPALDTLYRSRREGASFEAITAALGVTPGEAELLRPFFTPEAPALASAHDGAGVRVRYLGHAGVLIEAGGTTVLVDPVIPVRKQGGPARVTHADLPAVIDYVLVTESQVDHFVLETLLELRHRVRHVVVPRSGGGGIADPSLKLILEHAGFASVLEVGELEAIALPEGSITALPFLGKHGDLDIRTKLGFFVRLRGKGVMLLSDANNIAPRLYDRVRESLGDTDVLFIGTACEGAPMSWVYGSLFTRPVARKNDVARRIDGGGADKAMKLVDLFHPKHVQVYGMGHEPWLSHVVGSPATTAALAEADRLVEACRAKGILADRPSSPLTIEL